ncbi:unnamed protein product [Urochloa decumbens]|uniref:Uncharacterized protein n=1 Tax=Urochloa decumbens TaxID=240449 RepID=A0ABC8YCP3_9POAL
MMVSGGGGGREAGKKRKASAEAVAAAAMRREPRRGLGVAELERIRVALEVAERCYAVPPLSSSAAAPQPPPALPPAALVVHGGAGALAAVGNGTVQLQMPRGYFTPYYVAAQQYESLARLLASSGHPPSRQNGRQADQIQSPVTALPAMGQAASSESSSAAYQQRRSHRRAQPRQEEQPARTAVPARQVAFVDLVDSDDDDNGSDVEELDLELKL